jgi:hypothetical protein
MAVRFQLRRDTAANWTSANTVLELGEPGFETDTQKLKVGDGVTPWASLDYSIIREFSELLNPPTTLLGYGIEDAATSTQGALADTAIQPGDELSGVFTGDVSGSVFADDSTVMVDGVSATLNLANNTTTDLTEGTNLYFTDAKADARITAASITDLSDADQTVQTTDDVTFNSVTGNVITSQIDSADSSAIEIQTDVTMLSGLIVGNHIIPSSNENIDLGSASARFRDLYLSGNSAVIGDLALKRHTSGGLLVSDHSSGNATNLTTHDIVANNITTAGYIAGPAVFTIDPAAVGDNTGKVVIAGDLQVDGTQTTINSTTLEVDDKNITLSTGSLNSASSNGAGITVDNGSDTDATLLYNGIDDQWEFNKKLQVAGQVEAESSFRAYDVDAATYRNVLRFDSGNVRLETGTASTTVDLGIWAAGVNVINVKGTGGVDITGAVEADSFNGTGTTEITDFVTNVSTNDNDTTVPTTAAVKTYVDNAAFPATTNNATDIAYTAFNSFSGKRIINTATGNTTTTYGLPTPVAADIGKSWVICNPTDSVITIDHNASGTANYIWIMDGVTLSASASSWTIKKGSIVEIVVVASDSGGGSSSAPNYLIFGAGLLEII